MTLYELTEKMAQVLLNDIAVDYETGEILYSTEDLDKLDVKRNEKIENICLYIKDIDYETEALKNEKKNLDERIKQNEKKKEWLKDYLSINLQGEKFSTSKVQVGWRKSESVNALDESLIPDEYWRIKETREINKTDIKNALKEGKNVPGAELVQKNSIQIR